MVCVYFWQPPCVCAYIYIYVSEFQKSGPWYEPQHTRDLITRTRKKWNPQCMEFNFFVHVYIYIYVCMYAYLYIYMYTYICIYTYTCIYKHKNVDMAVSRNWASFSWSLGRGCTGQLQLGKNRWRLGHRPWAPWQERGYLYLCVSMYLCVYIYVCIDMFIYDISV